ncbi:MAG: glycosyltransferase family 39 protein, partial [Acidobacteriota bacterium]|nr:glycosyltransferase family 39 protein [Acidobacteriota bacterium]
MPSRFRSLATSLPLIAGAALVIRISSAWIYQSHTPHQGLAAVPFLFESGNIAVSLARGNGFGSPLRIETGPTAWMTPIYPLLLSAIMRIFGVYTFASWLAAVAMNVCFSSLACVPLYFAGMRIKGIGLASTAAWLWAIFPNAILLSYQSLWDTSLSALLGATVLWATLRIADSDDERDWTLYGLLWGIVLMTNAAVLSILPPLLGWAAFRHRGSLKNATLAAGMIVLACTPWTLRNYMVFHSLVPLRSPLGLQLWAGNNPQAKVIWLGDHHPM